MILVTALSLHIGYEKAAKIALSAEREFTSLRQSAVASGYLAAQEFDDWVKPEAMTTVRPASTGQSPR